MRRPNVDKMRRHAARSTPDVIECPISLQLSFEEYNAQYTKWVMDFRRKMAIKHSREQFRIEIEVVQSESWNLWGNRLLRIRCVPRGRNR